MEFSTRFDQVQGKIAPTLGDLRWVFWAIVQNLERYELFGVCNDLINMSDSSELIIPCRPIAGSWFLSSMKPWV